ncbi:hypothetical protein Prudu_539S000100 [Prunus dulcis]|uniref:Integrase zinc-binding domain-containing protein n=1 Tax=Prunus dulcis TaxID=3755 RepID=A0A5H2XKR0_PRUDU|nr:hypothetical protein Prudu_539S000100 [Prunus dulcis]
MGKFIKDFSRIANSMTKLTKNDFRLSLEQNIIEWMNFGVIPIEDVRESLSLIVSKFQSFYQTFPGGDWVASNFEDFSFMQFWGRQRLWLGFLKSFYFKVLKILSGDIEKFVAKCLICQQVKAEHQKSSGLPKSPKGRDAVWIEIPSLLPNFGEGYRKR